MIRASYSESTAWIDSPDFVEMILHDSIFIIELMLRFNLKGPERIGDPLMDEPCLENTIKRDLILLENQLPYFILEKLFHYKKTRTILMEKPTEKNRSGFSNGIPTKTCRKSISANSSELRRKILTEYFRRYLVIRSWQKTDKIWLLQKIDTYRRNTDAVPTILEFGQNSVGIFRRNTDGLNSRFTSRWNTNEFAAVTLPDEIPTNYVAVSIRLNYRRNTDGFCTLI